jgi:hypothetical protein
MSIYYVNRCRQKGEKKPTRRACRFSGLVRLKRYLGLFWTAPRSPGDFRGFPECGRGGGGGYGPRNVNSVRDITLDPGSLRLWECQHGIEGDGAKWPAL